MKRIIAAALASVFAQHAAASCGSAFCMVNTDWNVQGVTTEPGGRFDLRFEYIDQDQPRAGSRKVGVGEIPSHHDEVRTLNRNWLATYDYTFDENWGVSVTAPIIDREHLHIHNHMGAQIPERWDFTELGDLRVLARRQWRGESVEAQRLDFYGVNFGLKLPTGRHDVANADGEVAERTLQPGTGTTDLLLGAYFRRMFGSGHTWFANALLRQALDTSDGFKPGAQEALDLGYRYQALERLGVMLQLNLLHKHRDQGEQAEPEDSGGNFVYLSPGASYALGRSVQVYGFLQLPLYQYVNGVQLTADWAVVLGAGMKF